jgi:hypothetical protein
LRLQHGRGIEPAHRIDAALELRRGNHLKIFARGERQKILLADKGARFVEILAGIVEIAGRGGVLFRNVVENLADDLVFAVGAFQWSPCAAKAAACRGRESCSI